MTPTVTLIVAHRSTLIVAPKSLALGMSDHSSAALALEEFDADSARILMSFKAEVLYCRDLYYFGAPYYNYSSIMCPKTLLYWA